MIEVRGFHLNDVQSLKLRLEDTDRLIYRNEAEWLEVAKKSIAYTLLYDDKILCCGGVCFYREGFGEAWILCSHGVEDHPLITVRAVKNVIEDIMKFCQVHRVQATVRCDWDRAQKFIEFLGFQKEGTLRQYGPDRSDYYMYSRIR